MPDQNYSAWFRENLSSLIWWLDDVEIKSSPKMSEFELERTAADRKMQIFKEPVDRRFPKTHKEIDYLKESLIFTAIFGKESILTAPDGEKLYCFPGFLEKIGRLPKPSEHCRFIAEQWFEPCVIVSPSIMIGGVITAERRDAIGCRCYVEPIVL